MSPVLECSGNKPDRQVDSRESSMLVTQWYVCTSAFCGPCVSVIEVGASSWVITGSTSPEHDGFSEHNWEAEANVVRA